MFFVLIHNACGTQRVPFESERAAWAYIDQLREDGIDAELCAD